jgi:hypothetical protein
MELAISSAEPADTAVATDMGVSGAALIREGIGGLGRIDRVSGTSINS